MSFALQLNPEISVMTPKGECWAMLLIDYGQHQNPVFVVSHTETGEVFCVSSEECKRMGNLMYEQKDPEPFGRQTK